LLGLVTSQRPSDQSTPRGRKRPVVRVPLVSVGCRLIARRASGGIGVPGDNPAEQFQIRFASVSPFLRVEACSVSSVSAPFPRAEVT